MAPKEHSMYLGRCPSCFSESFVSLGSKQICAQCHVQVRPAAEVPLPPVVELEKPSGTNPRDENDKLLIKLAVLMTLDRVRATGTERWVTGLVEDIFTEARKQ